MLTPSNYSPCVGIRTCSDYSPFGVELDGRTVSGGYRYGFQNQEKDDEIKGEGNSINYCYRMHDPRLGRFLSVDPLSPKYPYNSTYAFSENRLIDGVELEGLEFYYSASGIFLGKIGDGEEVRVITDKAIEIQGGIKMMQTSIQQIDNGINSGYAQSMKHLKYLNSKNVSHTVTQLESKEIFKNLFDKKKTAFHWKDERLKGKSCSDPNKDANEQCADLAVAQAKDLGTILVGGCVNPANSMQVYDANNNLSLDSKGLTFSYINEQLEKNKVVVVGVHDGDPGGTDQGTDHWITIVGRGIDKNGKGYFFFADNACGNPSESADFITNRLYWNTGDSNLSGKTAWNRSRTFEVTRIQKNQ